jgi:L-ascorbate 6-phosphate lactonase
VNDAAAGQSQAPARARAAPWGQTPPEGSLAITWLGQAGFAIVAPSGEVCLIDPYLSDWGRRGAGVARIAPVVVAADEIHPTVVVSSHWHEDHLDPDTTRILARMRPSPVFVGPPANAARYLRLGALRSRVRPLDRGGATTAGPFRIYAGFARHDVPGWICEDAISIVVEAAGVRVFHTGDTEYDTRIVHSVASVGPIDVGLFCINGTGGNMHVSEAALLASRIGPRIAIPMHYGMWSDADYGRGATLDPAVFADLYRRIGDHDATILGLAQTIQVAQSSVASQSRR